MGIKQSIEDNPVVWLFGTLITGFLAGVSCYKAILQIANLSTINSSDKARLVAEAEQLVTAKAKIVQLENALLKGSSIPEKSGADSSTVGNGVKRSVGGEPSRSIGQSTTARSGESIEKLVLKGDIPPAQKEGSTSYIVYSQELFGEKFSVRQPIDSDGKAGEPVLSISLRGNRFQTTPEIRFTGDAMEEVEKLCVDGHKDIAKKLASLLGIAPMVENSREINRDSELKPDPQCTPNYYECKGSLRSASSIYRFQKNGVPSTTLKVTNTVGSFNKNASMNRYDYRLWKICEIEIKAAE